MLIDALFTSKAGFAFGFTEDDMMNAHWALTRNWPQLLMDVFRFWRVSPVYRPAGITVLKTIYSVAGMNLFVWRCAYGALFCTAVVLSFATAWRLTNRSPVALIAGLLMSFHMGFRWLYFGMGFIYDVTALIFTCCFLLLWFRARTNGNFVFAAFGLIVFAFGLQCKEIAIDGIVWASLYELIFDPPASRRHIAAWIVRRPLLLICAWIAIVFAVSRLNGTNALTQFPQYRVSLSPNAYFSHMAVWMRAIYMEPITSRAAFVVAPCLIMAFWSAWRLALWSILSFCVGVLPIAFIQLRGVQDLFVPSLPLAILVALALVGICEAVAEIFLRAGAHREAVKSILAGIVCLLIVLRQGSGKDRRGSFTFTAMDMVVGQAFEAAKDLKPGPNPNDGIVVESDPFKDSQWEDLFVFRLRFDSPRLQVKRPDQLNDADRREDGLGQWRHIGWKNGEWINLATGQH